MFSFSDDLAMGRWRGKKTTFGSVEHLRDAVRNVPNIPQAAIWASFRPISKDHIRRYATAGCNFNRK